MAPIPVHIKHAGKVHDVQLDVEQPPAAFKEAVYQVTGVPPDRMKVMVKGGVLKDDTDWKKVAPKEGQTFMVVGAAGELPKPPEKPIVFLEDMDDSELAKATELPVGLVNLGNTCYMNATVQAMRAIPELQIALENSSPQGLAASLKGLYTSMGKTTDSVTPTGFLNALRQAFPQFAELARGAAGAMKGLGPAYAQQDAEECWVQMTNALRDVPGLPGPSGTNANKKFVEQYMTGELRQVLKCDEAPEEPPSTHSEKVLKLDCNITITTNYMQNGIMNALDTKIEKRSPSLGRDAMYSSTSRLARLPSYLTVHMVRFAWRQDIGKKTKIMRKVKFPTEYDALDIVTDDLKEKLLPVSRRLKEIEKDRFDRRVVRKKTKAAKEKAASSKSKDEDVDMEPPAPAASGSNEGPKYTPGEELKDEAVYRGEELKELEGLVHPDLKADVGCSVAGLYDLVAIVTHKGAAADAGHYMGFVKKSALKPASSPGEDEDEDWYKFDDDKVSVFPKEKLATLDGGGEDSSAYVLLYKAKPLA